jgi:hypothetical protein
MSRGFSFGKSRTLECPLLAHSRHGLLRRICPLAAALHESAIGPKQAWAIALEMSAFVGKSGYQRSPRTAISNSWLAIRCRSSQFCMILSRTIGRTERVPFRKVIWSVT